MRSLLQCRVARALGQWEGGDERRALADNTFTLERAAVGLHDQAADP